MCTEICDGAGAGICDGAPSICSSLKMSLLYFVFMVSFTKILLLNANSVNPDQMFCCV